MKTEQVRADIAAENERRRVLASEGVVESMDTTSLASSLKDSHENLGALRHENQALQANVDAIIEDLERIRFEQQREREQYEKQLEQLREEISNRQNAIDAILENNVSLRFELSTYRRLLDVEEKHLNRMEEQRTSGQLANLSSSSSSLPSATAIAGPLSSSAGVASFISTSPLITRSAAPASELGTKKMTVQKTARGSFIAFLSESLFLFLQVRFPSNRQI